VGLLAIFFSPVVGLTVAKIDPRRYATFSFLVFALVLWMRSNFNTQADFWTIMIPTIIQGVAMAFFFIPLVTITLSGLPPDRIPAASGLSNFLRITAGGVPVLTGQPVPSGGITPVSVAVSRSGLVYVANQGNGGSGYSGFRLHPGGSLTPVAGSTVTVPDGSGLGDVFFNTHGNHLIGTRTGTSLIDSFVVRPDGRLLAAHGSPFTGQGLGQLGAEFSPSRPSQLFVSNAHNGTGLGTISAYQDAFSGHLTSIGSSPFADGQTAPCWVEISHDGKYLFTVNPGSGNISSYAIRRDGSLVLIGSFAINGGGANIDARLSPTASTCWSTVLACISSPSSPSTAETSLKYPAHRPRCPPGPPRPPASSTPRNDRPAPVRHEPSGARALGMLAS